MTKTFTYTLTKKLFLLSLFALFSVTRVSAQAPAISSFSPSSGPVGTSVTITGTGFNASANNNIVFFGATMATVTTASTTSLTVNVPAGATYEPISVLNGSTTLIGYSAKPFITTFTPNKGTITTADFNPRITFSTGGACAGIVIGDLDGDGKPDLAMANYYSKTVSVFRNTSTNGSITASSFASKIDFAAGAGAFGIAMGDLDGDGKPDLAVVNQAGNTLSIFRNTSTIGSISTSSFSARTDFATSATPISVAISDLDGDGKADLVISSNNAIISIFRNTSTIGSFTFSSLAARVDLSSGGAAGYTYIAVGDLDGDGKPDLAATNLQSNTVSVWQNTTTIGSINNINSFATPVTFSTGTNPAFVAIGDLDGDGKSELVVANGQSNTVSVLRNISVTGSITSSSFAAKVDFATGGNPSVIAIGDLDGDGRPDLAITNNQENTLSVLRNMSTIGSISAGSFAAKADFFTGGFSYGVAVGDLDGDGKADIAITNFATDITSNTISVLHSNPFFPPTAQATNIAFSNTTTNSSTANWANGNGLSRAVFIGAKSAGSPLPVNSITYTANPVFGSGTQIGSSGWYCIYNGTGTTVNITGLSSGATYRVMTVEYNGTAGSEYYLTDTLTVNPANVTTIAGGPIAISAINLVTSSPTNAATAQYTVTFAAPIAGLTASNFALTTTGNINGASITSVSGSGTNYTVTTNTGTGNGTIGLNLANIAGLTPGIITPMPFAGATYTIDRTTHTAPAITTFSPSNGPEGTSVTITGTGFNATATNNIVFFGATMATVTHASTTSLTVTVPAGATYQPISVLNGGTTLIGYSAKPFVTTFAPNKGAITTADFMPAVTFTTGNSPTDVAIGDLDGDGKPDLVVTNSEANTVSVLRNISTSGSMTANSFAPKVDFATGNAPIHVAVADLDGDGKYDIAVTNIKDHTISVLRNTSTAGSISASSFAPKVDFATGTAPGYIKISDLDGDGKPDMVITMSSTTDGVTFTDVVSIFRNTSTVGSITANSFAPGVNFNYGLRLNSTGDLAIGDIDGDGKPDIAVAAFESLAVAIFRNTTTVGSINSINSFAAPVYIPTAFLPISVAIGDLDGDGKPDLAVSCNQSGSISVLRNTSVVGSITAGSFAAHVDYPAMVETGQIAIGDLDGDGKADLAVASMYSPGGIISIYRNTSTVGSINSTSFAPKVDLNPGPGAIGVFLGDLDGDGKSDIVTTISNSSRGYAVAVLRNNPFFPPSVQATNVIFSNTATNSTTASWTNGNGQARAVFMAEVSAGSPSPINSTTYMANPVFASGTQIRPSGWYCVYNGTGTTVNITGLSSGAPYRLMTVEYNGGAGPQNYLTTTSIGDPANVTTVGGGPVTIKSIDLVTSSPTNASTIQYAVTFGTSITGLTINNFALATTGNVSGATISSASGSGTGYTVTVNTGTGDGTIGLNLANATGLTPGIITTLPFVGSTYIIDHTVPTVTIGSPSVSKIVSGAGQVTYTVTYADANFNTSTLSTSNITLNSTGTANGTVSLSGSGTSYTVTISSITGSGSLGISIAAGTASDLAGNNAAATNPSATFLISPLLSNLTVSSGTLYPMFSDTITSYTTNVINATSSLLVTPTPADLNATVMVNGGSASTPVNLAVGNNIINEVVTSPDGLATTTYTIEVTRAAPTVPPIVGKAPNIAYGTGKITVTGTLPFSLAPTNTGGAVPKTVYGQVSTFAGNTSGVSGTAGYVNGNGTNAVFDNPQDMAKDASGNLYVADANNNAIRMITPAGDVSTFAGSLTGDLGYVDGKDTSARFNYPDGLAFDSFGNLFVADLNNAAIRRIAPGGLVTTFYHSTSGTFDPQGMFFDNARNLIVALQNGGQIVKISPAGVLTTIAGTNGNLGWTDGIGAAASFVGPTDVRPDAAGNLFVADAGGNEIRKITPDGTVTTFAGDYASSVFYGNGVGKAAGFTFPTSLQVMPDGNIFVVDMWNNDIRKITPDGTVSLFAGVPLTNGIPAQTPGYVDGILATAQFNQPTYMRVDNTGTAYISEWGGNRIRELSLTGYLINGTLPAGLVFDATTGIISGTVTVPFATQTDTITAYNFFGSSSKIIILSYQQPSTIATLSNLDLNPGTLAPAFNSGIATYTASVLNLITSITVTPTTTDSNATVTVNGSAVTSGIASASIPLSFGPNIITTVVTAQDGITTDTYTVAVTRAASSDATLANLTASQATLAPAFIPGTIAYTDTVSNSVTSITVTPTTNDSNATVTINGTTGASGVASDPISLMAGENTITVVVTAQDRMTTDTYIVTVYKSEAMASLDATNILTPNGDGKNDYWLVKDIQLYPQNTVSIYDKAGRVVFSKHGYNNEWDGTLNGSPLAEGTYYFVVDLGPNLRKFKGYISILRN